MLLPIGSFILIVLFASYFSFYFRQNKAILTSSVGRTATTVVAALSCFVLGAAAVQVLEFDLSRIATVAVVVAVLIGWLVGLPFGRVSLLNGALAGALGAIVGVTGAGLFIQSNLVLLSADLVFIAAMFGLQKRLDRQLHQTFANGKKSKQTASPSRSPYFSTGILFVCVIVAAGTFAGQRHLIGAAQIGQAHTQKAAMDEENDMQVARIDLTANGLTPEHTQFKAGSMIKAIVNVKASAGEHLKLISKDLKFNADLKPGENMFVLNKPQPGTYEISVESKPWKATFTVE
ncbi:cupredoxin domain-containing protein [Paenibacillus cremeus]|uniref:EfeO-type cupredoxin-like domain-containing protein n=1 Tax=Paenibacillus cremeus TaxID=2163881 RepID=A0A559KEA1_9BACL|nr:cupredoxin domain-containing protein [Paenibacillus cremeus]TVY10439.1 hypothetical protein FPZ49_08570 [Paenibacillus cremeus]